MSIPKDLRFSENHEWVRVEDDKVRIGISDHAQAELGDIVFVELPEIGDEITAGDACGSLESTKAVTDLYAPISGRVVEANEALMDAPDLVNASPYGEAWMIVVEPSDLSELDHLMDAEQYEKMITE